MTFVATFCVYPLSKGDYRAAQMVTRRAMLTDGAVM
jgi:hypothetical protein